MKRNFAFSAFLTISIVYSGYHFFLSFAAYSFLLFYFIKFYFLKERIKLSIIIVIILFNIFMIGQLILVNSDPLSRHAFRFLIIFNFLIAAALCKTKAFNLNAFFIISAFHSFAIVGISSMLTLYSIFFGDEALWLMVRRIVLVLQLGDIWTNNAFYYRVQLLGNPVVYAFFCYIAVFYRNLAVSYSPSVLRFLFLLSVVGVIAAGNVNYLLGLIIGLIYFVCNMKKPVQRRLIFILGAVSSFGILNFLGTLIYDKFADGAYSGMHRLDLISTYIFAVVQEPWKVLAGFSVNSTLPGIINPYVHGSHYIELQTILVMYKLGLVLFLISSFLYLFAIQKNYGYGAFIFIVLYIFGSLANPYLYDTPHVLVTILCSTIACIRMRCPP